MNIPPEVKKAYDALGLEVGTPLKECGEHWRRLAKEWHPDLHEPGSQFYKEAVEKQKELNNAYDVLKRTDIEALPKPTMKAPPPTQHKLSPEAIYEEARALESQYQIFEAITIYKRLGNGGFIKAQFRLGYLYFDSIMKDLPQAHYWWKRAADQGHVLACYNLALMYEKGMGCEQDTMKARCYYEEAARRGDTKAQEKLGRVGGGQASPTNGIPAMQAPVSGIYPALSATRAAEPVPASAIIPGAASSSGSEQARAFLKRKST